jgi:hypothetical protein
LPEREIDIGGGTMKLVRVIELTWDYLDGALYYQMEWDVGMGLPFMPVQDAYSRDATPI